MVNSTSGRSKAFISYSHKDKRFLDELHTHLAYFERQGLIDYWDDQKLSPGMPWEDNIKQAIKFSRGAILLISPSFLASEFINSEELPPLVEAAKKEHAVLLSVIVRFCQFKHSVLASFQTVNNPNEPLIDMKPGKRDRVWARVVELVSNTLSEQKKDEKLPWPDSSSSIRTAEQWVEEGLFCVKDEVYQEALFAFGKALKLDPNNTMAHNGRGIVLSALHRHKEALGAFVHATEVNPNSAYLYQNKGNALNELGRYKEALEAFDYALRLNPSHSSIQIGRKIALTEWQKRERISAFGIQQRLQKTAEEWFEEGEALEEAKQYEEALAAYTRATRLNPAMAWGHNNMGVALAKLRRYDEALAAFERAIQLDPSAFTYSNKAFALCKLQRYEEALVPAERAIQIDPNHAAIQDTWGVVLMHLQRYEEAFTALDRAVQLDPERGIIYYHKGLLFQKIGQPDEAEQLFQQARALGCEEDE